MLSGNWSRAMLRQQGSQAEAAGRAGGSETSRAPGGCGLGRPVSGPQTRGLQAEGAYPHGSGG